MKTELNLSHGKYALAAKYFPQVLSGAPLYKVQKYCKDIATPKVAVTQGEDIVAFAVQDILNDLIVPQLRAYVKWGGKLCFLHVKWGGDGAGKEMFRDRRIPFEQPLWFSCSQTGGAQRWIFGGGVIPRRDFSVKS